MSRLRQCCLGLTLAWACLAQPGAALASADAAGDALASLSLPGPAGGLAAAAGLPGDVPPAWLLPDALRVLHSTPPGRDPAVERARAAVDAWLSSASGAAATDRAPSPLGADAWRALAAALDIAEADPVAALLRHRALGLTYLGLLDTPPPTRAFLAARPALLAKIAREHAGTFAAFAGSLEVADGRVAVPGGAGDLPLWEELVGARAGDAERFVETLLERRDGRLAFFYDTVARLDEPRRRFALAASGDGRKIREARVRDLVRLFVDRHAEWRVDEDPFHRPLIDPARVLSEVRVTDRGELQGPASRRFWRAVLEGDYPAPEAGFGESPTGPVRARSDDASLDAAWIVGAVLTPDLSQARLRLGAIIFVQRAFADVTPAQWAAVARAGHGFLEAPALSLVLERLGVEDPRVFARAGDRAVALARIGDSAAAPVALAQLQGGLALVDRLRFRRVVTADLATRLVASLVDLDPRDGRYGGAVVGWIAEQLLPAIEARGCDDTACETALLHALAGGAPGTLPQPPAARVARWEDVDYRVDPATAETSRLRAVLSRQRGARLGDVMRLARAVGELVERDEPGRLAESIDQLGRAASQLPAVPFPAFGDSLQAVPVGPVVAGPLGRLADLARRGTRPDPHDVAEAARTLLTLVDAAAADALATLAYAMQLGNPDGAVLLAPEIARRHAFGFASRAAAGVTLPSWDLPVEEEGQGRTWRVKGALLGLEVALADLSLRSVGGEALPPGPTLPQPARHLLELGLVLMNPSALEDAARDGLVRAVEEGRRRLEATDGCPGRVRVLAQRVGWTASREAIALWECREAAAAGFPEATLGDLFWTGLDDPDTTAPFNAWGLAQPPPFAALRSAWPPRRGPADIPGSAIDGPAARQAVDLILRVAMELAEHDLPSALAPGVLAPALFDLIHEAPVAYEDDGLGLALRATRLADDRLADYVSALTADGPLVPIDAGGAEGR